MSRAVYIGDEIAAAGYALAGLEVLTPESGAEAAALVAARSRAPLVLISAEAASRIAPPVLEAALAALTPITVVVPDLHDRHPWPDPSARLARELGVES